MSPGWVGCQSSSAWVRALDVGLSRATNAAKEAEVGKGVLRGNADGRQVQVAADDLGDLAERYAFVADPVQT